MSDTPLTDKAASQMANEYDSEIVNASFARSLERVARQMADAIRLYELRTDYTTEINGRNAMHSALTAWRELEKTK
jgi:hypothetical protein